MVNHPNRKKKTARRDIDTDVLFSEAPRLASALANNARKNQLVGDDLDWSGLIVASDAVFAIWREPVAKCRVGLLMLSGDTYLREIMAAKDEGRNPACPIGPRGSSYGVFSGWCSRYCRGAVVRNT
jgi:hypothetical protein